MGHRRQREITPSDIPALRKAKVDAAVAGDTDHFPELYVARRRGKRPQGAWYKYLDTPEIRALFDACGPERQVDLLNPRRHPDQVEASDG